MRAKRTPWLALLGSLVVGCLVARPGGAQWDSPVPDAEAANPTGAAQLRFMPPADQLPLPVKPALASEVRVTPALMTTDELVEPSDEFVIASDGAVVQAAYHTGGRTSLPVRSGPATRGSLMDYMASGRPSANHKSVSEPARLFGRGADAQPIDAEPAQPMPQHSRQLRISQSQMPAVAERTPAEEPRTASAQTDSQVERLLIDAHNRAATAATQEDFSQIITFCRRSLARQSDGQTGEYARQLASWALNRRGQMEAAAGHATEALHDFEEAIHFNPERWRAIHNRGVLMAQAGKFELAFDDFTRTIQLQPDYAKAYSNRAALLVVAGRVDQAAADYRRAVEIDPGLAVAQRGLGRCCHALGRLDEGLARLDAAIELDAGNAYTLASRGDLLTDLGQYADAAADYERALRIDPRSVEAYRGSAWLLSTCPDSSLRNPQLAVERATAAIRLDRKEDAVGYDTLAAALASAGQFRSAANTVRQAIDMAPDDQRQVYESRLQLYEHSQPFRIAPLRPVSQASYER